MAHSRSPAMHNAAFAALGLNGRYVPLPAPPGRVADAVRGLLALGFRGANVTAPHKESVLAHVDALSPAAQMVGAVNTLVIDRSGVSRNAMPARTSQATTPTCPAFWRRWRMPTSILRGKRAVLVGAGGAARAVVAALLMAEAADGHRAQSHASNAPTGSSPTCASIAHRTVVRAAPLTPRDAGRGGAGRRPADQRDDRRHDAPRRRQHLARVTRRCHPRSSSPTWSTRPARRACSARRARQAPRPSAGWGCWCTRALLAFDLWTEHRYDLAEITAAMFHALDRLVF